MMDASSNSAAEGFGPKNVSEAVDDFTGRSIPNSAAAIPGAATGANPLTHATPNRVRLSVDELSIVFGALNAWNMDGEQRRGIKTKIAVLSKGAT